MQNKKKIKKTPTKQKKHEHSLKNANHHVLSGQEKIMF